MAQFSSQNNFILKEEEYQEIIDDIGREGLGKEFFNLFDPPTTPAASNHTLDAAVSSSSSLSSQTGSLPCNQAWPGPYKFQLLLNSSFAERSNWVYLLEKNKLFVHMDKSVPVQVKLESYMPGLFLRALLVFVRDDDLKDSVRRCFIHVALDNPSNKGYENILDHVIRCEDPAAVYNHNTTSGRYSVVVPVRSPSSGSDTVTMLYSFTCKTSCMGGMNRRPTEVIFTLEYEDGTVVGRNSLNVRVCSCPKRDCAKEEKDLAKAAERGDTPEKYCKRVAATNTTRLATKRKNETDTDTIQLVCAAKHAKMLAGMLHAFHKFADDIKPETKTLVMSQLEGIMDQP